MTLTTLGVCEKEYSDMFPRSYIRSSFLLISLATFLTGCQMNAASLKSANVEALVGTAMNIVSSFDTSPERQLRLAGAAKQAILKRNPRSKDHRMEAKLQRMVDGIAKANGLREFDWQVYLLANKRINAFTPGGGVIFVEEGLVAQTETEAMMAMVLAHEMAHVQEAHPAVGMRDRSLMNVGANVLVGYVGSNTAGLTNDIARVALQYTYNAAANGYGRSAESEADEVGLRYFVKTGYNPRSASAVFEDFHRVFGSRSAVEQFFHGSHPQSKARAERIDDMVSELGLGSGGITQTREWSRLQQKYRRHRK